MKHMKTLTRQQPEQADQIQEIICQVVGFASGLLGAFGGSAPTLSFAGEKCNLPQPGDGDTTA